MDFEVLRVILNVIKRFLPEGGKYFETKVPGELIRLSEVFSSFWTCLDPFGQIRTHSDAFGWIRMHSDASGSLWSFLENFERFSFFLTLVSGIVV